jgi:hypothetical protein
VIPFVPLQDPFQITNQRHHFQSFQEYPLI